MQELDLRNKQNPYLTKLGISSEVQALFYGTYKTEEDSNSISFEYGEGAAEHYSLGFHRLPSVPKFWKAGVLETNIVTEIIIGYSALDVMTYLSKKLNTYSKNTNLLFLATGARLYDFHLDLIKTFNKKRITLIFDNTFLGRISDIKVAAAMMDQPIRFEIKNEDVTIQFKYKKAAFNFEDVSLNVFLREFKVRLHFLKTQKSKGITFLQDQINLLSQSIQNT